MFTHNFHHKNVLQIRLSALALIVETNRSTEILCQADFKLLRLYLKYNINCEVPSFRQQTLALISKVDICLWLQRH